MFSDSSFHDFYLYSMYIAIFGAVICALILFWPSPDWVRNNEDLEDLEEVIEEGRKMDGRAGPALVRAVVLVVISAILSIAISFFGGVPIVFGFVLGIAIVAMIYPTIINIQNKTKQRQGRVEAMSIAEFVAGRMGAEAPLFESLENLYAEFTSGKRDLPLCGEDLGDVIRRVRLGNDLSVEMYALAIKYSDIVALSQVWTTYRLMASASMGQEAEIYQANDLSESLSISDELVNVLETEMSTATMSRIVMFLLIGGMIGFLLFFGGELGDVLINTLPGNGVIGFSLLALYIAQTVGTKLEELPILEF